MKYVAYKLSFQTGVHLGKGMLNETRETFLADTLYSALCIEAVKNECLDRLDQMTREGRILFSDAFPFIKDSLYIPKPMMRIEYDDDISQRKKWKKLKYIPLTAMNEYFEGKLDVQKQGSELKDLGEVQIHQKVSLVDVEKSEPYSVGVYYFHEGNGLYFIMGYKFEEDKEFVEILIDSLGYQGIGGKVSTGLGKFSALPVEIPEEIIHRLNKKDGVFVLLSTSLPMDTELEDVLNDARYMLERRGGFIQSNRYAEELVKKQELYFLKSGSVVRKKFEGDVYNVGRKGKHPVWRYAKPILLEVSV